MVFNSHFKTSLIVLTILIAGCTDGTPSETQVARHENDKLRVAMDIDMPGYFSIENEDFGYQYDLLSAFAVDAGLELEILPGKTLTEIAGLLASGDADLTATLTGHTEGLGYRETVYSTTFSVVARHADAAEARRAGKTSPAEIMEGKKVMISSAFKQTSSWDILLDSVRTAGTYVSSLNAVDLVEGLRSKEFDFLVCEKSEAHLITALNHGFNHVADFDDTLGIAIAADGSPIVERFAEWFASFSGGERYAQLNSVYFEKESALMYASKTRKGRGYKGISEYDMIMREVCEREGYDWRLLSAIAYNESRFTADIVSHRGAQGLCR